MRFASSQAACQAFSIGPVTTHYDAVYAYHLPDVLAMLDLAELQPGMSVLDLGCGSGKGAVEAYRRVGTSGSVVAVDISPAMIQLARKNVAAAALPPNAIEFVQGDITSLANIPALHDRHFDRIISLWALSSMLPSTHVGTLQQWRGLLTPLLGRIVIDHTHPDEAAAAFVALRADDSFAMAAVVCDETARYAECEQDLQATVDAAHLTLVRAARFDRSSHHPTWSNQLALVTQYAQKQWKGAGAPDTAFVEETRRRMLEKWTDDRRTKQMQRAYHRTVAVAGVLQ